MYRHLTGVKQGDKYLYVLPFNHIAGYSGALQHLVMGCELDVIENMDSVKLTRGFQIFQPSRGKRKHFISCCLVLVF